MTGFSLRHPGLRLFAALLPLSLTPGCHEPLASKDAYFLPGGGSAAAQRTESLRAVRYHRALQAAQRSCGGAAPPELELPDGPDRTVSVARRAALTRLCADLRTPSPAAHGGTENAYRRWVEDGARTLPEASATAAGAAGGS